MVARVVPAGHSPPGRLPLAPKKFAHWEGKSAMQCTQLDRVPSWFVVLPDCPAAEMVAKTVLDRAIQVARHPSGRVWILGRWADEMAVIGEGGANAIAVIGEHQVSSELLSRLAEKAHTLADLDHQ